MATRRPRQLRQPTRGRPTERQRAPRPAGPLVIGPPDRIAERYAAALSRRVAEAHASARDLVTRAFAQAAGGRTDADEPREGNPFVRLFGRVRLVIWAPYERDPEQLALPFGDATQARHGAEHERIVGRVLGVDPLAEEPWLDPMMQAWTRSNVELIRGLSERSASAIEAQVLAAWTSGASTRDLARYLERAEGITRSRAELIAYDQVGKLHGQLSGIRQAAVGVEQYIWRTSMDERVRQTHADLHGTTQSWADAPAPDGHPGQGIRCRCGADPVLDDLLTEEGLMRLADPDYADDVAGLVDASVRELGAFAPQRELAAILPTVPGPAEVLAAMTTIAGVGAPSTPTREARQGREPLRTPLRTPRQAGNPG